MSKHLTAFLDEVTPLVAEFERLLNNEQFLLSTGKIAGMQALASAKQAVIESMQQHAKQLSELFASHAHDSRVAELQLRLKQCQIDNQSNHSLVMLELKHTNKSLDLLRSVLNMDDLSLYSSQGEVLIKREQRRIGSA